MKQNEVAAAIGGCVCVFIVLALVTPWWTLGGGVSSANGHESTSLPSTSAQPFDGRGATENGNTVVAGILLLGALVAAATATTMLASRPGLARVATACAAAAGFLALLAVVLATTWPAHGTSFWGSRSQPLGSVEMTTSAHPAFGWFAAFLGGALAWVAALRAWRVAAPLRAAQLDATATPDGRFVGPDAK